MYYSLLTTHSYGILINGSNSQQLASVQNTLAVTLCIQICDCNTVPCSLVDSSTIYEDQNAVTAHVNTYVYLYDPISRCKFILIPILPTRIN